MTFDIPRLTILCQKKSTNFYYVGELLNQGIEYAISIDFATEISIFL